MPARRPITFAFVSTNRRHLSRPWGLSSQLLFDEVHSASRGSCRSSGPTRLAFVNRCRPLYISESVTGTGDQLFIRNSEYFEPLCIDDSTKSTHSHTPVSAGSGLIPDSHTPISMGSGLVPDSHTPISMGSGLVPDSLASDLQSDRVVQ